MKISRITISNFQSFGPKPVPIDLSDSTRFVGVNDSGKSAILAAMCRLFGVSGAKRTIVKGDFHIPYDSEEEEVDERSLSIEVRLEFPELGDGETMSVLALPECFNQMIVEGVGSDPFLPGPAIAFFQRVSSWRRPVFGIMPAQVLRDKGRVRTNEDSRVLLVE